jgi:hypothetical protein
VPTFFQPSQILHSEHRHRPVFALGFEAKPNTLVNPSGVTH